MFAWSRGETWLAVGLSVLIVLGGAGHLWLTRARLEGATVVVEAAPAVEGEVSPPRTAPGVATEPPGAAAEGTSETGVDAPPDEAGEDGCGAEAMDDSGHHAPSATEAASGSALASGAPAPDVRININTALPAELERLPGIGPKLATRIVEYRAAWGPFSSVEDVMEVSGIGPRKFEDIKELITVD